MPREIWILVVATTVSVTGGSFLWPMNSIYMHNELGKSLAFAGFILMLNQAASVAGNLIGGTLFDKYSAYKRTRRGRGGDPRCFGCFGCCRDRQVLAAVAGRPGAGTSCCAAPRRTIAPTTPAIAAQFQLKGLASRSPISGKIPFRHIRNRRERKSRDVHLLRSKAGSHSNPQPRRRDAPPPLAVRQAKPIPECCPR